MEAFRREGDYWAVGYVGRTARIADTKGMGYLARLLADPGREFHALDLVAAQAPGVAKTPADPEAGLVPGRGGSAGSPLDAAAKAAYRQRMVELREDLDEAERFGDPSGPPVPELSYRHWPIMSRPRWGWGARPPGG